MTPPVRLTTAACPKVLWVQIQFGAKWYYILVLSCAAHRALVVQKEQILDFFMEDGFDTRSFFTS